MWWVSYFHGHSFKIRIFEKLLLDLTCACSVTGRLQTAGSRAGPVPVLRAPPHGPGHLQHICETHVVGFVVWLCSIKAGKTLKSIYYQVLWSYQHYSTRARAAECVTEWNRGGNSTNYCASVEFISLLPPSMNHCFVLWLLSTRVWCH